MRGEKRGLGVRKEEETEHSKEERRVLLLKYISDLLQRHTIDQYTKDSLGNHCIICL